MDNSVAICEAAPEQPTKAIDSDLALKRLKFQRQLDRAVHEKLGAVPIAIRYFTMKAEQERARREKELRRRSIENMSEAHRHFRRLTIEKDDEAEPVDAPHREKGSPETKRARGSKAASPPRPAAVEHFARKAAAAGGEESSQWAGEVAGSAKTMDTDDFEE